MADNKGPVRAAKPGLAVRRVAASVLKDVLAGQSFAPIGAERFNDPRDRALANKLVTVALRRHGHLNQIIAGLMEKGVPPRSGLFAPLLRIGLTELLFIEQQAEHSAVFLPVEILRKDRRGGRFAKLLNGVLRQAQREAEKWKALDPDLLIPDWLKESWSTAYGDEMISEAAKMLLAGPDLDLSLKAEDPELVAALGGDQTLGQSVRLTARDASVADLPGYAGGQWWVQDAAASVPAGLISKPAGARVLDLCAAPGGKTAQLCRAGYQVTALDRDPKRMVRVKENLRRLGYEAELVEGDALAYRSETKFDAILIDAPCTATGTFRRHPEVLWHRTPKDLAELQAIQRELISHAAELLAEGGELIFCTCSLQPEEGEAQAEWAAAHVPGLRPVLISAEMAGGYADSISPQGWFRTQPGLSLSKGGKTDGFFAAKFARG